MKKLVLKRKAPEPVATAEPPKPAKGKPLKKPEECRGCKHIYTHPCHGENAECPNWQWLQQQKTA